MQKYQWNDTFTAGKKRELELLPVISDFLTQKFKKTIETWLNPATNLIGMRECDILDSLGNKWEVKFDRKASETGNVFLEHNALQDSSADFVIYSLQNGGNYMLPRQALLDIIASGQYRSLHGGDFRKGGKPNPGTLFPVEKLKEISQTL